MHMLLGRRPEGQRAQVGGSGLGWWWHTDEDTLDKCDPQILEDDTRVYALTALRLCNAEVLPYDVAALAAEVQRELHGLQQIAGEAFDLGPALALADALSEKVARLGQARDARTTNRAIMGVIRALNNVNYTANGPFDQDSAVPARPFPSLQGVRRLAGHAGTGSRRYAPPDDAGFLRTRLVRERNRVCEALNEAIDWAETACADPALP
jgi:hypothetical protein